jgi:iron uptake system component EfeO
MSPRPRASRTKVRTIVRLVALLGAALLLSAGCRTGTARSEKGESAESAEGGEGLETEETEPEVEPSPHPVDPRVAAAVRAYEAYLYSQAAALPTAARRFTDAVRAGDLPAARASFAASRTGWERIQSVAALRPDLDRRIDAEADDFASTADPAWTGWHRLEYAVWGRRSTAGAGPYADRLDRDLVTLSRVVPTLRITPARMAEGIERLVEEAIAAKLPGDEDRYARTDLADLAGNIQGARAGYAVTRSFVRAVDPALAQQLDAQFATVDRTLGRYRTPTGYRPYPALTATDRLALRAQLTTLAETLAALPATLAR